MQQNKGTQALMQFGLVIGILIFINILANIRLGNQSLYTYLDLTEDKRYSLTKPTRQLLNELDDVVSATILLDGEFPAGFKRLQKSTIEMLDDMRSETGYIEYTLEDPSLGTPDEVNERYENFTKDGIFPTSLRVKENNETTTKVIFPYVIFYYKGRSAAVQLLENQRAGAPQEVVLNNSVGLLEYKFANAIQKLKTGVKRPIAFTTGHGELGSAETADLERSLRRFYETGRFNLDSTNFVSPEIAALIIAKPTQAFSDNDKFKLDQYVMNGGRVLWLVDKLAVDLDSLRREVFLPREFDLDLDDLLFRYGARIQPNLVLDLISTPIPLAVGRQGNAPQFEYIPYPYHIVSMPGSKHPIVKSVDGVNLTYTSTIDTSIRTKTDIQKTILLSSSERSMTQFLPLRMNFDFMSAGLNPDRFNKGRQVTAILLEGIFPSMYTNRVTSEKRAILEQLGKTLKTESVPNKMIVVSDGDVAKNGINAKDNEIIPLGMNQFDRQLYANKDFLLNAIEYLVDDTGLIEARGKEVKLRMLDGTKVDQERGFWQILNIGLPILFLSLFGIAFTFIRNYRYKK